MSTEPTEPTFTELRENPWSPGTGTAILRKMHNVMRKVHEIGYLEKRGTNEAQRYKYAMEADFLARVAPILVEEGVVVIPTFEHLDTRDNGKTSKETPIHLITLSAEFTFFDVESGEQITVTTLGEGTDSGDKACYKAMTGATKYCLAKTFLIPTGDDPEKDEPPPQSKRASGASTPPPRPPETGPKSVDPEKFKAFLADQEARLGSTFGDVVKASGLVKTTIWDLGDQDKRTLAATLSKATPLANTTIRDPGK